MPQTSESQVAPVRPRPRRSFKLIAAAFSLLVALLLGEVVVRALHLVPDMRERLPGLKSLYQPDGEIGYVPRPNVTTEIPDETGRMIAIRTDANGARIDSTGPARADQPAVAVLGDSFTANLTTADGQTLCAALSQQLGGRPVLNFGCLGFSNAQEVALARRWAPKYHIDTLVLAICAANDLTGNLTWARGAKVNDFSLSEPGKLHALARKSQLFTFVFRTLKTHATETRFDDRYDLTRGLDKELLLYDAKRPPAAQAEFDAAVGASAEAITEFKRLADELGARSIVVLIPTKAMVCREALFITNSQMDPRAEQALAAVTKRGYDFDAVRETWQTIAQRAGVRFVDLTDPFRQHRAEVLFGQIDRHWIARGQQLAAEVIAKALGSKDVTWASPPTR
jgi:hypothetical protein